MILKNELFSGRDFVSMNVFLDSRGFDREWFKIFLSAHATMYNGKIRDINIGVNLVYLGNAVFSACNFM